MYTYIYIYIHVDICICVGIFFLIFIFITLLQRYLDYFIHSLAYEYRNSGVTFQCLIPFYTATRMTGYSERLSKGGWIVPDAARYASSAVETFGRSQCTTGYFPHTLQVGFIPDLVISYFNIMEK